MSIPKYVLVRLAQGVPVLLAVIAINFVLIHAAPGDPTHYIIGDADVDPAFVERLRAELGLDQAVVVQLWRYLRRVASGGTSAWAVVSVPVPSVIQPSACSRRRVG